MRTHLHSKHGFTLLESALVLAISGLVIAGLWVVAANLFYNQRLDQLEKGIITTASHVRNFYRDRQMKNDQTTLTNTNFIQLDLVAPQLQSAAVTGGLGHSLHSNANNGIGLITISYDAATCGVANSFAMTLTNLTQDACTQLLPRLAGTRGKIQANGISQIMVGGTTIFTATTTNNITMNDFNPTALETNCTDGVNAEICFAQ